MRMLKRIFVAVGLLSCTVMANTNISHTDELTYSKSQDTLMAHLEISGKGRDCILT